MSEEEFTNKVGGFIAGGMVSLGISMGSRLGLFEALAKLSNSRETSVTAQQLADSLKFKERYVREWVNGMACSGLVSHQEIEAVDKYWIEPHCLPALLGNKLFCQAQYSELVTGAAYGQLMVEECFPVDGPQGTDVDKYDLLHEFLRRKSVLWKHDENVKKIIDDELLLSRLEEGISVMEVGCGSAHPTRALAVMFPKSKFMVTDLTEVNVERAKKTCQGLENVKFAVMDACKVPEDMNGKFDFAMVFDVYHDVPYPDQLITGIKRILKPGGMFLMNEIDVHESVSNNKDNHGMKAAMFYLASTIYCTPTSYKHPGGAGLGACAGKELYERVLKAEFAEVKTVAKEIGLYFLCTK